MKKYNNYSANVSDWTTKKLIREAKKISRAINTTEEDGEVYSSIPEVVRCPCCKNEVWERFETVS